MSLGTGLYIYLWVHVSCCDVYLPSGDLGELKVSSDPLLWDSCLLKERCYDTGINKHEHAN